MKDSEEAENTEIVLDYIIKFLNESAYMSGEISNHLGIDRIKQFLVENTKPGGIRLQTKNYIFILINILL